VNTVHELSNIGGSLSILNSIQMAKTALLITLNTGLLLKKRSLLKGNLFFSAKFRRLIADFLTDLFLAVLRLKDIVV
jgi:hypothetical protein